MTNEQKKQELRNRVYKLWTSTVKDNDVDMEAAAASSLALTEAAVLQTIYMSNVNELKEFLIDRNSKGERPNLIISAPVTNPETKLMEDRYFMPQDPEYNQEVLDSLKKSRIIPEDSTVNDYDFILKLKEE